VGEGREETGDMLSSSSHPLLHGNKDARLADSTPGKLFGESRDRTIEIRLSARPVRGCDCLILLVVTFACLIAKLRRGASWASWSR